MDDEPPVRYAALVGDWLVESGYSHCFLVAGGGCMHLIEAFRSRFVCIPVVHEVTAGIAVEHFNECSGGARAFALVTTGPGLTNIATAVAACWAQRRELLVIAGQVKSTDLLVPPLRQRGIQEVDGTAILGPVSVHARRLERPLGRDAFRALLDAGRAPHPGPVVIEVCLDVQGAHVQRAALEAPSRPAPPPTDGAAVHGAARAIAGRIAASARPLLLLGGLLSRRTARETLPTLERLGVPVMTTTSAIDRIPDASPIAAGRPGTWGGQRAANLLLAQADLLVAIGARLDLQQTGYNWRRFAPGAAIVQVYPCAAELAKGHPTIAAGFPLEPDALLRDLAPLGRWTDATGWGAYVHRVRELVPVLETANETGAPCDSAFRFLRELSAATAPDDILALCSSGGTFTGALQVFEIKPGQVATTSPALASMGWGLGAAIGASLANPGRRVVLTEGDGGFSQNLQELALVRRHDLPITIFLLANRGYASIRATQRKFFGGASVGCDEETGLGFPDWEALFAAYRIPAARLPPAERSRDRLAALLGRGGPSAWIVDVDPEQPNYPAVTSRINADGSMESEPLWLQEPPLSPEIAAEVGRYLPPAAG